MASLDWNVILTQLSAEQTLQLKAYSLVKQVGSTNEMALQEFCRKDNLPAVCFAESQTHGRGRNGRCWVSPESQNIYMSVAWRFKSGIEILPALSLAVGVVIADVLNSYGLDVSLKWPNDIQVKGKKLAGVLLESQVKVSGEVNLVIGVGLNVYMPDMDALNIDQLWTDIVREKNSINDLDRNEMAGKLLSAIMCLCSGYEKTGFASYRQKWLDYDVCSGVEVQLIEAGKINTGQCLGINEKGALRVLIDGDEQIFYAADVSVRVSA